MPRLSLLLSFLCFAVSLEAQVIHPEKYSSNIMASRLMYHINYLADSLMEGRECGKSSMSASTIYLLDRFQEYGLRPIPDKNRFIQSFPVSIDRVGRNITGMIPGRTKTDEYVIISAHYDHLGRINGTIYPGADDNASGVAILLNIAQTLGTMVRAGEGPRRNVIFVCYDAKEFSLAGSAFFAANLPVSPGKVIANINLDQIGTSLAPPGSSKEYLLVVGADLLTKDLSMIIKSNNDFYGIGLSLDFSFYQSKSFADIFFRITDQIHLHRRGIPSALFTSGINNHSYKPTDTPSIIDAQVLETRALLCFHTVWDLANRISRLR